MGTSEFVIEIMVYGALAVTLTETYLRVNKVWIRRYDRNVADSISVAAAMMGIATAIPTVIREAFFENDGLGATHKVISIVGATMFLLIGIGFWARRDDRLGFWGKFKRAFALEGQEATDLARGFLRPVGARQILTILRQVALIDRDYAAEEHRFISDFARTWHLESNDDDLREIKKTVEQRSQEEMYIELRQHVVSYLKLRPPNDQVAHLLDVIRTLVRVDKKVTVEESFILTEISGLMDRYISRREAREAFHVLLVPQNDEQRAAIQSLLPELRTTDRAGGKAVIVDTFYSEPFADMICTKHRALGFFTTVDQVDLAAESESDAEGDEDA